MSTKGNHSGINKLGFLSKLFGTKSASRTYDDIAEALDRNGVYRIAGVTVNAQTALRVSTVLSCVKVLADGCATPPLHVFREIEKDGRTLRKKANDIPMYRLLNSRPNEFQTSFEWRRMMTVHAALTGSGLSIKVRNSRGKVIELLPVSPGQWREDRVSRYEFKYSCYDEFGLIGEFSQDDVFLLRGVQWDWAKNLDVISLAQSAVGLAIATEHSQMAMHENGLRPSGVYSVEGTLDKDQHARLKEWIKKNNGGINKTGEPFVLDKSGKWLPISFSSVDAQHLETRRQQVEEVCRVFGVFPIMIGHSDKTATFASAESFFSAHLIHSLAPWHANWQQRIDEMLLDGDGPLFAEFDTRYMRAGSLKDKALWARTMAETGIYTRNEIRDEDGKDPLPGLDEPLTPLNMSQGNQNANQDAANGA